MKKIEVKIHTLNLWLMANLKMTQIEKWNIVYCVITPLILTNGMKKLFFLLLFASCFSHSQDIKKPITIKLTNYVYATYYPHFADTLQSGLRIDTPHYHTNSHTKYFN